MRADPARIAVLEYELLYIVPEEGSPEEQAVDAAIESGEIERHALCLRCSRAYRPDERFCLNCTDCPEHGNDCSPSHAMPWETYTCDNYQTTHSA